ncbi:hypothetical protein ACH4XT_29300 [Streptomyces avidinii]|uniref:hypothetical protein n=1 Tax=Streptomyces avidinii TaxID=1895 RepID=UPI00379A7760
MNADLVRELGRPDRRLAAAETLAAGGATAAEAIVRELTAESSPVEWGAAAPVLRRIGGVAFDYLLQGLLDAPAEAMRNQVGHAFARLGPEALDRYTAALSHPSPLIRRWAVLGIQHCDEAGLPEVPALLRRTPR